MTQNSEQVLNFLKQNYGTEFSKQQIAEALGISVPAVTGSMNSPIKKKIKKKKKKKKRKKLRKMKQ